MTVSVMVGQESQSRSHPETVEKQVVLNVDQATEPELYQQLYQPETVTAQPTVLSLNRRTSSISQIYRNTR